MTSYLFYMSYTASENTQRWCWFFGFGVVNNCSFNLMYHSQHSLNQAELTVHSAV